MLLISKLFAKAWNLVNANYSFLGFEDKLVMEKNLSPDSQIFAIIFFFHFSSDALLLQSVKIFIQE